MPVTHNGHNRWIGLKILIPVIDNDKIIPRAVVFNEVYFHAPSGLCAKIEKSMIYQENRKMHNEPTKYAIGV